MNTRHSFIYFIFSSLWLEKILHINHRERKKNYNLKYMYKSEEQKAPHLIQLIIDSAARLIRTNLVVA